jgi:hypothetical protein
MSLVAYGIWKASRSATVSKYSWKAITTNGSISRFIREIGHEYPGCYNPAMAKEGKSKKTKAKRKDADSKAGKDEDEDSSSEEIELEPVKSKKGEPDDNLRRRAEWFQKRTGG